MKNLFSRLETVFLITVALLLVVSFTASAYLTAVQPGTFSSGSFTGTITSGTAGGTNGALILNGSTSGAYTLNTPATVTSYTETVKAAVPAQGDILDYSNGTGQRSSIVDVAVGSVLISGGVGAVPTYGTVPAAALSAQSSVAGFYRSNHAGSSNAVVSNSAANVFPFDGTGTAVATTSEGTVSTVAANIETVKNMECVLTTAAGVVTVAGGTSYVVALRQNLSSSTVTCTIATAASSCTDTTHSITTAIGDQLDYIDTPSGTPTALVVKCSAEVDI